MGGGLGVGRYKDILRGLLTVSVPLHLVIFTGKNQKLYRSLHLFLEESPVSHHRIDILQYTENIVDWMAAADILVTKPGGLTLAEALTVGVPLVLIDPVPGHEEENAEYVVMTGAALTATTSSLPAVVQDLLAHQDLRLRLRRAARNLARPDAAQRIAQIVSAAVTL
jgi:processive 1,2-diacylglycerol beta-glucosyltransferase